VEDSIARSQVKTEKKVKEGGGKPFEEEKSGKGVFSHVCSRKEGQGKHAQKKVLST